MEIKVVVLNLFNFNLILFYFILILYFIYTIRWPMAGTHLSSVVRLQALLTGIWSANQNFPHIIPPMLEKREAL